MNLRKWNDIYQNNQELDRIFIEKYANDPNLFTKNCIELLVEIGEFVNETKVFKYWTNKKMDKEKALEEYADIVTMILTFYQQENLSIKASYPKIAQTDIFKIITTLYKKAYDYYHKKDKMILEEVFFYTIHLGVLFEFQEEEIFEAIIKKQKIIKERLNSNY